jgi:hypothetical protein
MRQIKSSDVEQAEKGLLNHATAERKALSAVTLCTVFFAPAANMV